MQAHQTALDAFVRSGWELVDEHPENPSGYGVDCPDCGQPTTYYYWPVGQDVGPVNGFGCDRCQNVVPTRVTESDRARFGVGSHNLEIVEAEFRDGSTREIRCAPVASDPDGGASP